MTQIDSDPVEIPIDGTLDLHTFAPGDVSSLVEEYLWACLKKGIYEVRIIHGKGKGVLRRIVHARLEKHPNVLDFSLDSGPSGWGLPWSTSKQTQLEPDASSLTDANMRSLSTGFTRLTTHSLNFTPAGRDCL